MYVQDWHLAFKFSWSLTLADSLVDMRYRAFGNWNLLNKQHDLLEYTVGRSFKVSARYAPHVPCPRRPY